MIQTLILIALAASSTTKIVQTEEYLFQVPLTWESPVPKAKDSAILGSWQSPDKSIILNLMKTDATSLSLKDSCVVFTEKMLGSSRRKNLLPEPDQKLKPEALKFSKASEASQSLIEVDGKGDNFPIQQKSLCLKDSKNIWMLTGTYPKKKGPQVIDSIFSSFQLKAHK